MVELVVTSDRASASSVLVRKYPADRARLAAQVRWLTRAQGPGVVRLHEVDASSGHYSTVFAGPRTLAVSATAPGPTLAVLLEVWRVLERVHRLGLAHGSVTADHLVVGAEGPFLVSPDASGEVGRATDIADFGRLVTGLAEVWSIDSPVPERVVARWLATGRSITELVDGVTMTGRHHLVSGAEVRRMLIDLDPSGRWSRRTIRRLSGMALRRR